MTFSADTAPQTPLALGNTAGASASFTSEKMRGADAVFGPDKVAVVFPVGWSSILVGYGFKGVSAGNPAAGGGVSGSVAEEEEVWGWRVGILPTLNRVAGAAVRQTPGATHSRWSFPIRPPVR